MERNEVDVDEEKGCHNSSSTPPPSEDEDDCDRVNYFCLYTVFVVGDGKLCRSRILSRVFDYFACIDRHRIAVADAGELCGQGASLRVCGTIDGKFVV